LIGFPLTLTFCGSVEGTVISAEVFSGTSTSNLDGAEIDVLNESVWAKLCPDKRITLSTGRFKILIWPAAAKLAKK
jgi:hypothetical protein